MQTTIKNALIYSPQTKYENGKLTSDMTSGGDAMGIPRVKITDAALDQSDTSLNKKLWSMYPVEQGLDNVKQLGMGTMFEMMSLTRNGRGGTPTADQITKLVPLHEQDQRCQTLIIVYGLIDILKKSFPNRPFNCIKDAAARKRRNEVEPLKPLLVRLEAQKNKANEYAEDKLGGQALTLRMLKNSKPDDSDGKASNALLLYLDALFQLLPWHATPEAFSGTQAYELGVAQLHGSLLLNLAIVCTRLGDVDALFYRKAMQLASLVIEMRYAKHDTLKKAMRTLNTARNRLCSMALTSPGTLPAAVEAHTAKMEKKNVPGWAHEKCLTPAHEGCC